MTETNNRRPPIPQATMPKPSARNVQNMLNFMSDPSRSPTGSDVATMDDAQFSASLDALLETCGRSSPSAFGGSAIQPATKTAEEKVSSVSATGFPSGSIAPSLPGQAVTTTSLSRSHALQAESSSTSSSFPCPQTVMFPTQKSMVGAPLGPSPLTKRLSFSFDPTSMPARPMVASNPVPSTVSSITTESRRPFTSTTGKRMRVDSAMEVSENEGERNRRRIDRNVREQQRSHRISEQVASLREVLAQSDVKFKPDKYSTLVSAVAYIKQLQDRSTMLDAEHKQLLTTIEKTSEITNSAYFQASTTSGTSATQVSYDLMSDEAANTEDDFAVFVKGLDYKSVFEQNSVAMAVASIDGRFLDCNAEFEQLAGLSREELLPGEATAKTLRPDAAPSPSAPAVLPTRNLSLFNLLSRQDMEEVFSAMSQMIQKTNRQGDALPQDADQQEDYWTGVVKQGSENNQQQLTMIVTLVRSPRGRPKFFNVALTPLT